MRLTLVLLFTATFCLSCSDNSDSSVANSSDSSQNDISFEVLELPPAPDSFEEGQDPLLEQSWHLKNTGQKAFSSSAGKKGEDIGLEDLHELGVTGEGVRIAVSDNGVETTHPELWFNHLHDESRNYKSSDPGKWIGPPDLINDQWEGAHGTSVSGLIVARDNNKIGARGVAPRAKFAGFLYLGVSQSDAKMLDQAQGDFDIFNFSYGRLTCRFSFLSESYIDQLRYGVQELRQGKGALYIKAAGNEFVGRRASCLDQAEGYYFGNANLERDNSSPYVINVAAISAKGVSASYSTPGSSLWISAPGGEFGSDSPALISADLQGCQRGASQEQSEENDFEKGSLELNENCDFTSTMNGTSASTPLVSGVIALMLQANPSLSWRDVKFILAKTARKVDPLRMATNHPFIEARLEGHTYQQGWIKNSAGFNFHNWYGFGAVDAKKAVELAENYDDELPRLQELRRADGSWKYSSKPESALIPDASPQGLTDSIVVDEDRVIEALQIRLSVEHSFASDLGVELISPAGTKSQLLLINSGIIEKELKDVVLLSNAFYGESSKGEWELKVIDGASGDTGELKEWKLNIFGHESGANQEGSFARNENQLEGEELKWSDRIDALQAHYLKVNQAFKQEQSLRSSDLSTRSIVKKRPSQHQRKFKESIQNLTIKAFNLEQLSLFDINKELKKKLRKAQIVDIKISNDTMTVLSREESQMILSTFSLLEMRPLWQEEINIDSALVYEESLLDIEAAEWIGAFRSEQGLVEIISYDFDQKKIQKESIETKIALKGTELRLFKKQNNLSLIVFDESFIHRWDLSVEKLDLKNKFDIKSFGNEKIVNISDYKEKTYVLTSNSLEYSSWNMNEKGEYDLFTSYSKSKKDKALLLLGDFGLLKRKEDQSVHLEPSNKELLDGTELIFSMPSLPSLFDWKIQRSMNHKGSVLSLFFFDLQTETFNHFELEFNENLDRSLDE